MVSHLIICNFFDISGSPDEISLGFINEVMNFSREDIILHNVIWHASKGWFSQNNSASHVEKFDFPASQLIIHVVKDELKVSWLRFTKNHGKSKIFPKKLQDFMPTMVERSC